MLPIASLPPQRHTSCLYALIKFALPTPCSSRQSSSLFWHSRDRQRPYHGTSYGTTRPRARSSRHSPESYRSRASRGPASTTCGRGCSPPTTAACTRMCSTAVAAPGGSGPAGVAQTRACPGVAGSTRTAARRSPSATCSMATSGRARSRGGARGRSSRITSRLVRTYLVSVFLPGILDPSCRCGGGGDGGGGGGELTT